MKSIVPSLKIASVFLGVLSLTHLAAAQDVIPLEKAQKGAHMLAETAGRINDPAVVIDPDLEKPFAIKGGGVALMVIPDKTLTAEKLAALSEAITPIGQLWTMDATVAVSGRSPTNESLRFYTVKDGDGERRVQLYLVGAAKNAEGKIEVMVFGQGKEPLVRLPLEKSMAASQELPITLVGRKNDEDSGTLTLRLPGQHLVDILLVKAQ
jgi:hypothetical protein